MRRQASTQEPLHQESTMLEPANQTDGRTDFDFDNGKRALTDRGRNAIARILKCATDIFVTEGYGGLSMRKVASSAGISLSNLQHYFPGREDLFAALMRQTISDYTEKYEGIRSDTSLSPEEQLETVVRMLIEDDKQSRMQSLFVNMWALAQTHDFARQIMDEAYVAQRRTIRDFIEAVNPDLTPLELARRAALITSQIDGLIVLIPQRNRFPSDIRGLEDEAVRAILALAHAESGRGNPKRARTAT
ncbi:TetR/AcrR family transcriptional regulator [Burkholderia cepacia]|uniref:TetR/AcrR family transcriptional regulator n=1 Tax=Burkholderia cepacia TaxID=292 RepID=UPI001CF33932|nr:TetR/AcrR family transcriptional regulator [Burkholderia cepacia]MCA8031090.1 TetR/AcrR family transcriptional regulator [Burkholderia cepacia]